MPLRSIAEKADVIATFRYVSVFLMETLARWTPVTPELEVKILFGRHLWEFAQHADALGKRTAELRAGLHYTRPPVEAFRVALDEFQALETTGDRVRVVYDVLVPDLAQRYAACLAEADELLDQPTIRLMDRIQLDLARLDSERSDILKDVNLTAPPEGWITGLRRRLADIPEIADARPARGVAV